MGLDIYVGSLTRYYTGDWETVVQKDAREQGVEVEIVGRETTADAVTDPEEIRSAVLSWRDNVSEHLGSNLESPLDWEETPNAPYFTDKPAWDSYASLLLWAAYSENPELTRPNGSIEEWATDPAFELSTAPGFKTAFPQLLRDVQLWLPQRFRFTFRVEDLSGQEIVCGSSVELFEQLKELNRRTWNATDAVISEWRRNGAEHNAPMEIGARFAFSIMNELSQQAIAHRLIMKLDY
jgi:hypothetical protein